MKTLKAFLIALVVITGTTIGNKPSAPTTLIFADEPLIVSPIIDHCVIAVGNCIVDS